MKTKTLVIILIVLIVLSIAAWYVYKHYQKQLHRKFPIKKGSKGKGVQLAQLTFDTPLTGVWDDQFNELVRSQTGNASLEWSKKDLFDYWFKPALTAESFPLTPGSSSGYVMALQVMLGAKEYSDRFDNTTLNLVQKAIGKNEVSLMDYLNIGADVFGITNADFN